MNLKANDAHENNALHIACESGNYDLIDFLSNQ